jgi:diadenylate cyclase
VLLEYLQKVVYQPLSEFIITLRPVNIIELIILLFLIVTIGVGLYRWYVITKGTPTQRLINGAVLVILALVLSKIFNLRILGGILESIVNIIIFSLIVIFQPELRRLLGYLGQPGILTKNLFSFGSETEVKNLFTEVAETVKYLSKSHIGALFVLQNSAGYENYSEVGTRIDAQVSTELLLTIFHPNTPLHDGAVVISGSRIVAAGVLLPLTEDPTLSWKYGTRHRAAIGMSEVSDAVCIVVSEETGEISLAQGGILTKYNNVEELKRQLEFLYGVEIVPEKNIKSPKTLIQDK